MKFNIPLSPSLESPLRDHPQPLSRHSPSEASSQSSLQSLGLLDILCPKLDFTPPIQPKSNESHHADDEQSISDNSTSSVILLHDDDDHLLPDRLDQHR